MVISNFIGIISDDLTGANDAGLQFHLRGSNTQILLNMDALPQSVKNTQTWVATTATRNSSPEYATTKMKEIAEKFLNTLSLEFFYKKIDSALRGNIAIETLAMMKVLGKKVAIIIPAFPAENKITVGGYQLFKGLPIERTELARDPVTPIYESHVPTLLKEQLNDDCKDLVGEIDLKTVMKGAGPILIKIKKLLAEGKTLIVADSVSITDIEQISLAIKKSGIEILPVGTTAAAQVFANDWVPEHKYQYIHKTIPELPKLIVSGSSTPITLTQIKKLEQSDEFENTYFLDLDMQTILDDNPKNLVTRVVENLAQNNTVIVHASTLLEGFDGFSDDSLSANLTKAKLIDKIENFLADLTKLVAEHRDFILITLGNDTSYKTCDKLNSHQLQLIDEIAPEIALTLDHKAQWIVTKSGHVGNPNTLIEILKYFSNHVS